MTIHKEGYRIIISTFTLLLAINIGFFIFNESLVLNFFVLTASSFFFFLVIFFFRSPLREIPRKNNDLIYSPADGTIVAIEQVYEGEYFNHECKQISIFMSPLNVHLNRYPIEGIVRYVKYHPGKYLVAFHPKSSIMNERITHVIENEYKGGILVRQIAGAVARRIVAFHSEGEHVEQGAELGFIKFGSRVDIFLPLNTEVKVKLNDRVRGNKTVIACFKS